MRMITGWRKDGGAKEARTPDLLNAIQTLYQLSYDPIQKTDRHCIFFPVDVKTFHIQFCVIQTGDVA